MLVELLFQELLKGIFKLIFKIIPKKLREWKNLRELQKELDYNRWLVEQIRKGYKIYKNRGYKLYKQYEKKLQQISDRLDIGRKPTQKQKEYLDMHSTLFVPEIDRHRLFPLNSSWCIQATYYKVGGMLLIQQGRRFYRYFKFPLYEWIFLTLYRGSVGKAWWKRNLGFLYSNNPQHWISGKHLKKILKIMKQKGKK